MERAPPLYEEDANAPGKFAVRLDTPDDFDSVEVVRQQMTMLWRGQSDRHGTPDEAQPLNVSPEQAEAAVHLAVLLVTWLTTGVFRRR